MSMTVMPQGRALTITRFDRCLTTAESCDLSGLRFIDAFGVVGTAACLVAAEQQGARPHVDLPAAAQMREHLAAMGFMRFLAELGTENDVDTKPIERPDVVVPLSRIAKVFEAEQLSHLLWANAAQWDAQVLEALTEGLWELAANSIEHSGAEALLMGQVYHRGRGEPPDHDGNVQIVIGDAGRGIRGSFLESTTPHAPADDAEAIQLALRYLVSSVPDAGRGQGLTTTVEQATALGGKVVLRSGNARVTVARDATQVERVADVGVTVVGISLPLIPGDT